MSDRTPFIETILANPDDDGPRLVYADWLDERGESARAEFIRVQCELARLPQDDPRRPDLERRERELLDQHASGWLQWLYSLYPAASPPYENQPYERVGFRRGFLPWVEFYIEQYLDHADRVFEQEPIASVHLALYSESGRGCDEPKLELLMASPHLQRVTELSGPTLLGRQFAAFISSPFLTRLEEIDLSDHGEIGGEGLAALLRESARFPLRRLNLAGAIRLPPDTFVESTAGIIAARDLANCPHLAGLTYLNLCANYFGQESIRALVSSPYLRRDLELELDDPFGFLATHNDLHEALRNRFRFILFA